MRLERRLPSGRAPGLGCPSWGPPPLRPFERPSHYDGIQPCPASGRLLPEFREICEGGLNQQAVRGRCVWVWTLVWLPLIMVMGSCPMFAASALPLLLRGGFTAFGAGPVTTKDPTLRRVLLRSRGPVRPGLGFSPNRSAPAVLYSVCSWRRRPSAGPAGAFRCTLCTESDQISQGWSSAYTSLSPWRFGSALAGIDACILSVLVSDFWPGRIHCALLGSS